MEETHDCRIPTSEIFCATFVQRDNFDGIPNVIIRDTLKSCITDVKQFLSFIDEDDVLSILQELESDVDIAEFCDAHTSYILRFQYFYK